MAPKKSFLLRIDASLWNDLQAWADDELRSVNGQIEYVLREAVTARRKKRSSEAPENVAGAKSLHLRGKARAR